MNLNVNNRLYIFFFSISIFCFDAKAQIIINEASNRNFSQILDEDGENEDWFELYNGSDAVTNIEGWSITDNKNRPNKWAFSSVEIQPESHLLVFASGKDKTEYQPITRWESPVLPSDTFSYLIPDETTPTEWKNLGFDDAEWDTGVAGFGYGDNDDNTVLPEGTVVAYIRKSFDVSNIDALGNAICHVDYDDGFVAYINGVEICRSNVSGTPSWNSTSNGNHDAQMFSGGAPDEFSIDSDVLLEALQEGENIFAIEVHNVGNTSSDLSLIPFLTFAIFGEESYFSPSPEWISNLGNSQLHTSFKISEEGETLYLYDSDQNYIDSLVVNLGELDYSVGRATDGDDMIAIFNNATPGESNNDSEAFIEGFEESPQFNRDPGFYSSSINILITIESETGSIRYTTDGSEPTESSQLYDNSSINLSETTTINAKTFSSGSKLPSATSTITYFINENFTVPVLVVTTNNDNLYGSEGIFTNWRESWNKPCYVEYFEADGTLAFKQKAGIQVDGGAGGSRSKDQHSFRIEPGNGTFGDGNLKYNLIPDRPDRDSYESFYLRNGSNQHLILPYKDAVQVKSMGQNTYNYYSAYRPAVVFINGEYFGLYELREKINADYLEQNYDMDTDSIDLIGVSYFKGQQLEAIEGSIDQYLIDKSTFDSMDPSSSDYLEKVDEFLDLNNYTDYIIAQSWIANVDWPDNNIKIFRTKTTDYRWQFALIDLEWSFLPHQWSTAEFDHIQYMLNQGSSQEFSGFWYGLMQNDEYKNRFINRFADLMNTNYDFLIIGPLEQSIYDEFLLEMPREYERWGDSDVTAQMEEFTSNHYLFRSELEKRSSFVRTHLREHYDIDNDVTVYLRIENSVGGEIKINTVVPESYPWVGSYFSGIPIDIEAIPDSGYRFVGWNENPIIEDRSNEKLTIVSSNTLESFVAEFELIEEPFTGITITEINYKDGSDFNTTDWFEIYNGNTSELNLEGWYFTDNNPDHRYDFDAALSIPSNGHLVVVRNTENFTSNYPTILNFTGPFEFGLSSNGDDIRLYDATGTLISVVTYSDDSPWPLSGDETGLTLELLNPYFELSDPDSWTKGCVGGSPGSPYDPTNLCGEEQVLFISDQNLALHNYKVYPNPSRGKVNLEFTLGKAEHDIEVNVYDIIGKLIKKETIPPLLAGDHIVSLDLSSISNHELLFLTISTSNGEQTVKIVLESD